MASIHVAVLEGKIGSVQAILDEQPNKLNEQDSSGMTPLMHAASCGDKDMVDELLKHSPDVLIKDNGGATAMHYAAKSGKVDIIEKLVLAGCCIHTQDKEGLNALGYAELYSQDEAADLLRAIGVQ